MSRTSQPRRCSSIRESSLPPLERSCRSQQFPLSRELAQAGPAALRSLDARKAGLPGLLVHDLRRSAVRRMEQAGVPRSVAMKLTGHRTESVYRRYAITSDADLRDAAKRLGTLTGTLDGRGRNGVAEVRDTLGQSR